MNLNYHCRFDAEHGVFSNGIALRQHYDAHHPEYAPKQYPANRVVRCRLCGKHLKRKSLYAHLQSLHPDHKIEPEDAVVELEQPKRGRPKTTDIIAAAQHKAVRDQYRHEQIKRELPPFGVDNLDDIVMGVVQQLAEPSAMVPVVHLPALFLWRDQTQAMLRRVTGSQ